jgi:hypothetical protein
VATVELRLYDTDDPLNFDGPVTYMGPQAIILPGQTPIHIARLCNWLYDTQGFERPDTTTAIGRAAAWFLGHVNVPRPVTRQTVQWQTRGEIELQMANYGPTCSAADLAAAIAALPNPGHPGAAPANSWDDV